MLILKLILVPFFVGLAAIIGRVWGASAAGLISGLPIIAGPIVWFMYCDQGLSFALGASESAIRGVIALSFFCVTYAWCSTKWNWMWSWIASILVYVSIAFSVAVFNLSLHVYLLLSIIVIATHLYCAPKIDVAIQLVPAPLNEIIVRMFFALCLVFTLTLSAENLGHIYSGIFATFPVAGSVIALFTHKNYSASHAIQSLRSMKVGLLGMLIFFYSLSWLGHLMNFEWAMLLSIVVTLCVQFFIFRVLMIK